MVFIDGRQSRGSRGVVARSAFPHRELTAEHFRVVFADLFLDFWVI